MLNFFRDEAIEGTATSATKQVSVRLLKLWQGWGFVVVGGVVVVVVWLHFLAVVWTWSVEQSYVIQKRKCLFYYVIFNRGSIIIGVKNWKVPSWRDSH